MPTNIKMESFVVFCARDAAHVAWVALEHGRRDAFLAEEICGGETGGTGAENGNFRLVHLHIDASMAPMRNPLFGNDDAKRPAPTFTSAAAHVSAPLPRVLRALMGWTGASAGVRF